MQDNIFSKFGMDSTGFNYPADIKARMAGAYFKINGVWTLIPSMYAVPVGWYNPTYGAYSSTKDMLNYIKHLLAMDEVLSPNGFERFFSSGVDLADGVSSYGHSGFEVAFTNNFRTYSKHSSISGFTTNTAMIRDLNLGIFSWTNFNLGESVPAKINAIVFNALAPAIVNETIVKQPAHETPGESVMNTILGSYDQTVVVISKGQNTDATGIFTGSIKGTSMEFVYDKVTSEKAGNDMYFFRHYNIPPNHVQGSCFMRAMQGNYNGLVKFYKGDDNKMHAYVIDSFTDATKSS